jgi:protocatechuate 3,4-dioxygenase beta subunit
METKIKRGAVTRRRALGLAGVAGAAYVAGPLRPFGNGSAPAADPESAAAATCVLAPEVTEGPYWVDVREKRSDVRAGQEGVPLTLSFYVYRSDDGCAPEQGAVVDIWHCNAAGLYSDESSNRTAGETWLRGYQETDAAGLATFTTVFPGWYAGRAVHIHVRVRTFSGSATTYDFTTQVFFSEEDIAKVYAVSPYSSHGTEPDVANSADMIYGQEVSAGNVLMPTLSGSTAAGLSGSVGIGLSGLPAGTGSGSSGSGSNSASSSSRVEAKLVSRRFERSRDRRELTLRIDADERVAAEAELYRSGRRIARKRIGAMLGEHKLAVPLRDSVAAGPARLRLTLTDRAGNVQKVSARVKVPAG